MIHPHRHRILGLIGIVLPLGLPGCSETVTTSDSPPSSAVLQRHYEKTLTKAQQEAVIDDLQSAAAKKPGEPEAENAVITGSTETN